VQRTNSGVVLRTYLSDMSQSTIREYRIDLAEARSDHAQTLDEISGRK